MQATCRPGRRNQLYIAEVALVEVVATFCRMVRETPPRLDATRRNRIISQFRRHVEDQYFVVHTSPTVYTQAADLCRSHPLRAYDAVQLMCALTVRERAIADEFGPPIFVCADTALLAVATAEGLSVENPNDQP